MECTKGRIQVYGADWCPMTIRALSHLNSLGVDYEYIDVEQDPEASQWVKDQNGGKEKKPTYCIDGDVLTYPSERLVEEVLEQKQLL